MVIFEGLPDKLDISLSSECFVSSASSSQLYTRKVSFKGEKSSVAILAATIFSVGDISKISVFLSLLFLFGVKSNKISCVCDRSYNDPNDVYCPFCLCVFMIN